MFKKGFVIYGLNQGTECLTTRRIGQVPPVGSIPIYFECEGTGRSLVSAPEGYRLAEDLQCIVAWQHLCQDLNRQGPPVSEKDIHQLVKYPGKDAEALEACKPDYLITAPAQLLKFFARSADKM